MRQVIHHVPDSHLNAYIRFKLALTESEPTIKPYDEKQWAELADVRAHSHRSLFVAFRKPAHTLDLAIACPRARCVFEDVSPSGNWPADLGYPTRALRMAWPPPSRTHHLAANSNGLELNSRDFTRSSIQRPSPPSASSPGHASRQITVFFIDNNISLD